MSHSGSATCSPPNLELPFQALSRPDPLAGVALDVRGVGLIDEGIHTVPIVFQGESRLSIGTREMPSID